MWCMADKKRVQVAFSNEDKRTALTLRLDEATYKRLRLYAATSDERLSHQDILLAALNEYLDRRKAPQPK